MVGQPPTPPVRPTPPAELPPPPPSDQFHLQALPEIDCEKEVADWAAQALARTDGTAATGDPHWNKNALVSTNVTTNFSRVVFDLLSTSAAKKKNRPFYLGKSPHSGEEKIQPQQPCPTIIPVWRATPTSPTEQERGFRETS